MNRSSELSGNLVELSGNLVVDANLATWTVLPILAQIDVKNRIDEWIQGGARLLAPAHWIAEAVSAIRMSVYTRLITAEIARVALEDLFALEIETVPVSIELARSAMVWAGRLRQARAYDSLYLALAEELNAELWTADERLANRAHQIGVAWVRWVGEAAPSP